MPRPRGHRIPFEDWDDYLDVGEASIEEMTLQQLITIAKNLCGNLHRVLAEIEKHVEEERR